MNNFGGIIMTILIPEKNMKWKNKNTGYIFPGNLILGNLDSPDNYELVGISEYEIQVEKEEKAAKLAELEAMLEAEEKNHDR